MNEVRVPQPARPLPVPPAVRRWGSAWVALHQIVGGSGLPGWLQARHDAFAARRRDLIRAGAGRRVPVVEVGTDASFDRDRPAVFRGAAAGWGCMDWTLDGLADAHGDDLVWMPGGIQPVGPVMQALASGSEASLRFWGLIQRHPERLAELDPAFLRAQRDPGRRGVDQGFQAFFGNACAEPTPLHAANDSNLFIQIRGRKHWVLYPPEAVTVWEAAPFDGEYRRPADRDDDHGFDPFAPDAVRHPEAAALDALEVVLEPGDVLYNPPYWWHAVRNLDDPTLALGHRWLCPSRCARVSPLLTGLDLVASRPPLWRSIATSRKAFPLVFMEQYGWNDDPRYEAYVAQVEASYPAYCDAMARAGLS